MTNTAHGDIVYDRVSQKKCPILFHNEEKHSAELESAARCVIAEYIDDLQHISMCTRCQVVFAVGNLSKRSRRKLSNQNKKKQLPVDDVYLLVARPHPNGVFLSLTPLSHVKSELEFSFEVGVNIGHMRAMVENATEDLVAEIVDLL